MQTVIRVGNKQQEQNITCTILLHETHLPTTTHKLIFTLSWTLLFKIRYLRILSLRRVCMHVLQIVSTSICTVTTVEILNINLFSKSLLLCHFNAKFMYPAEWEKRNRIIYINDGEGCAVFEKTHMRAHWD